MANETSKTKSDKNASTEVKIHKAGGLADKAASDASTGNKLYANVALLHNGAHGNLKVASIKDYRFANTLNSTILAAAEFPQAAAHYPIVFSENDGGWAAFAVLGPKDGENAFVGKDGAWTADTYIPGFVRRYPFILVEDAERKNFSLAADMDSDILSETSGEPLYDDGKPTKAAENVLKFCLSFHNQLTQTRELIKRMAEAGILVSRTADVTMPDQSKSRLVGFHVIDEAALTKLEDGDFLKLRNDGVLNLIYCHLWSMRSWNNILT